MGEIVQIMINNGRIMQLKQGKPLQINDLLFNIICIIRSATALSRVATRRQPKKAPFPPYPLRAVEGDLSQNFPSFWQKETPCTN